jgi:hypothetical protein
VVITLNVNRLNSPTERYRLARYGGTCYNPNT